jgi:hypothetical protein
LNCLKLPPARRILFPALLGLMAIFFSPHVRAFSTGIPNKFTVDPATVRQKNEATTPIIATVLLKSPSPEFFVCQVRSSEPEMVTFPTIIFKKGDLKGMSEGAVHWSAVTKDATVKVTAFSVEAPDLRISFTISLKPQHDEEDSPL